MLEIIRALRVCYETGTRAALATIVSVEGSTYRREGVRCLIREDGDIVGIVSGGCVEGDLAERAQSVWESGQATYVDYDFRDADDLLWGLGLGCNGALKLFVQPFDPVRRQTEAKQILDWFERRWGTSDRCVLATVVESEHPTVVPLGTMLELSPADPAISAALSTSDEATLVSSVVEQTPVRLFVEQVNPRPRLLVFGAGPDAVPVVRMGYFLQWRVSVIDHRPNLAVPERFPDADEVIRQPRDQYGEVALDRHTYAVIMTHNYEIDVALLSRLIPSDVAYIGALGPRRRTEQMLSDLSSKGVVPTPAQVAKLHSPVGLDVGAESPEEIALSIVSEALARQRGRDGRLLSTRVGPLHPRQDAPAKG